MGHNALIQRMRLELVDHCLRKFAKPMNIDQIAAYCNGKLEKPVSARQYKYDIDRLQEEYGIDVDVTTIGGKKCYTYSDHDFSIKDGNAIGQAELNALSKITTYLSDFAGLGADAGLNDVTDEIGRIMGYDSHDNAVISFEKAALVGHAPKSIGAVFAELFRAIVQHQALNVTYTVVRRGDREWTVHPQFLKQYNQRWYLMAIRHGAKADEISNLALDRIKLVSTNNAVKYVKSGIDFADYFADVVGVTKPKGTKPQEVILSIDRGEYSYIESKPIHPSQDELFDSDDSHVRISLYVYDNYELRSKILSLGSKATVVEPQSLRDKLKQELLKTLDNYK